MAINKGAVLVSHKIRTTITPDEEIEVDDGEYLDLERNGLILKPTKATTSEGLQRAAINQTTDTGKGTA